MPRTASGDPGEAATSDALGEAEEADEPPGARAETAAAEIGGA